MPSVPRCCRVGTRQAKDVCRRSGPRPTKTAEPFVSKPSPYPPGREAIATGTPRPPREVNPELPVELEEIIMKAMAREPDQRYQSTKQLFADLAAIPQDVTAMSSALTRWAICKSRSISSTACSARGDPRNSAFAASSSVRLTPVGPEPLPSIL